MSGRPLASKREPCRIGTDRQTLDDWAVGRCVDLLEWYVAKALGPKLLVPSRERLLLAAAAEFGAEVLRRLVPDLLTSFRPKLGQWLDGWDKGLAIAPPRLCQITSIATRHPREWRGWKLIDDPLQMATVTYCALYFRANSERFLRRAAREPSRMAAEHWCTYHRELLAWEERLMCLTVYGMERYRPGVDRDSVIFPEWKGLN